MCFFLSGSRGPYQRRLDFVTAAINGTPQVDQPSRRAGLASPVHDTYLPAYALIHRLDGFLGEGVE